MAAHVTDEIDADAPLREQLRTAHGMLDAMGIGAEIGVRLFISKGEATWPATSVSLITGERDAVLIDAAHHPGRGADRKMDRGDRKESHHDLHHPRPRRPSLRPEPDPQRVPGGQGRHRGSRGPRSPGPAEPGLPAVVVGHKRPDAPDDDPAAILGGTKAYLRDFERSLAGSHSAQALVDKMMAVHGDLGNLYTLWTAAQAVFEQGQGASS